MNNNTIIDSQLEGYKSLINNVFQELHQLTLDIKNKELAKTVDDIRTRLNEPFLFVIAGEVKVGKSSFVNALLDAGRDICKVAPDPCTDTVQQIVYGESESTININPYLKKITIPVDILKKVAIVDTPGTNTVLDHHQEITEKFIPVSDLIIFVFEAKNPYRHSAWKFFDYIKNWQKKIIFVLQQSDLMEPEDLKINLRGVTEYAKKRGISDPIVFAVSAKQEIKGDKENSGFIPVREFIKNTVTGSNNVRLKVQSLLDTSRSIRANIAEGIEGRKSQLEVDQSFRIKVDSLLDRSEAKAGDQVDTLIDDLLREYDKQTADIRAEFVEGLGIFNLLRKSFLSIFNSKESLKEWIEGITQRINVHLKPALERKLRQGVVNIADSVRQMTEIIDAEIRKNKSGLKNNNEVFSDIANKRQEKMEHLQNNITQLITQTEDFVSNKMLERSATLVPNMAVGAGLMGIGVILLTITQGIVIDVTGGIISAIGLSVASLYTLSKRKKIIRDFDNEIYKGRMTLKEQVEDKLTHYIKEIRTKIDNNFLEFDAFINEEQQGIDAIIERFESIEKQFKKVAEDLELRA